MHYSATVSTQRSFRVYSDRTGQRQFDGVKHNALVLEPMLVKPSIQTGRVTAQRQQRAASVQVMNNRSFLVARFAIDIE